MSAMFSLMLLNIRRSTTAMRLENILLSRQLGNGPGSPLRPRRSPAEDRVLAYRPNISTILVNETFGRRESLLVMRQAVTPVLIP